MKAVLFDLDGTLLDRKASLPDFARWQARTMLASEVSDENAFAERFMELDANGTVWKKTVYRNLVREFSIEACSVDQLLAGYETSYCEFCQPTAGAVEAVERIRTMGMKIGLVSNGPSPFQERNFGALGISHLFDAVVTSGAVGYRKPRIEIFQYASRSLDVHPSEVIFVGDNPKSDIGGANAAGMYSIYVPSHFGDRCEQADGLCPHLSALPDLVTYARSRAR